MHPSATAHRQGGSFTDTPASTGRPGSLRREAVSTAGISPAHLTNPLQGTPRFLLPFSIRLAEYFDSGPAQAIADVGVAVHGLALDPAARPPRRPHCETVVDQRSFPTRMIDDHGCVLLVQRVHGDSKYGATVQAQQAARPRGVILVGRLDPPGGGNDEAPIGAVAVVRAERGYFLRQVAVPLLCVGDTLVDFPGSRSPTRLVRHNDPSIDAPRYASSAMAIPARSAITGAAFHAGMFDTPQRRARGVSDSTEPLPRSGTPSTSSRSVSLSSRSNLMPARRGVSFRPELSVRTFRANDDITVPPHPDAGKPRATDQVEVARAQFDGGVHSFCDTLARRLERLRGPLDDDVFEKQLLAIKHPGFAMNTRVTAVLEAPESGLLTDLPDLHDLCRDAGLKGCALIRAERPHQVILIDIGLGLGETPAGINLSTGDNIDAPIEVDAADRLLLFYPVPGTVQSEGARRQLATALTRVWKAEMRARLADDELL